MQTGGDSGLEDDEIEVLLKGSELEKLMSSISSDVEVFGPARHSTPLSLARRVRPMAKIPADFYYARERILTSGLMLTEDMTMLLEESQQCIPRYGYMHRLQGVLLPCSGTILICASYFTTKSIPWLPCAILSAGATAYLSVGAYRSHRLKKAVMNLLSEMAEMYRFIKLTAADLKEAYTNVNSKLVITHLSKNNSKIVDRYYSHIESDIAENVRTFMETLVAVLCATRDATRDIVQKLGSSNFTRSFFIAFCSDEELGLPAYSTEGLRFADIRVSKLEELCDQLISMQSEYLRALGMWLSATDETHRKEILATVDSHLRRLKDVLAQAKHRFSSRLFSKLPENRSGSTFVRPSKDIVLAQLNLTLTSLLCEVSTLKDFIRNKEKVSTEDEPYLGLSMAHIQTDMLELSRIFKQIQSFFRKKTGQDPCTSSSSPPPRNVSPTTFEVGRSDFSVASEDRVYLGVPDHEEDDVLKFTDEIEVNPSYPKFMINELKGVLEGKRLEFQRRESEAIAKSHQSGLEDQFDLVVLNKPLSKSLDDVAEKSGGSGMKTRRKNSLELGVPSNTSFMNLTKSIAASAASTSKLWNRNEEECFGDEIDEDDDDE